MDLLNPGREGLDETVRLVLDLIVGRISGRGSGSGSGWLYDLSVLERDRGFGRPPRAGICVLSRSAALFGRGQNNIPCWPLGLKLE